MSVRQGIRQLGWGGFNVRWLLLGILISVLVVLPAGATLAEQEWAGGDAGGDAGAGDQWVPEPDELRDLFETACEIVTDPVGTIVDLVQDALWDAVIDAYVNSQVEHYERTGCWPPDSSQSVVAIPTCP